MNRYLHRDGRIVIVESTPPSRVAMTLDMLRPLKAHNLVDFTLEHDGDATRVTWAMQGSKPFLGKVMGIFIDCEKMCGTQFEEGLAKLKSVAEGRTTGSARRSVHKMEYGVSLFAVITDVSL